MKRSILFLIGIFSCLLAACGTNTVAEPMVEADPTATPPPTLTVTMSEEEMGQALLDAVRADDATAVASLLAAGADVNTTEPNLLFTPVFIATLRSNADIFTQLVEAGADLTWIDKQQNNLMHHAATANSPELAELILKNETIDLEQRRTKWGFTPLLVAAFDGNVEMVEFLLANGANMEAVDDFGDSTFNVAAWAGQLTVLEKLIELGANPTAPNGKGLTGLDHAKSQGHDAIVAYIESLLNGASTP